MDLNLYGMGMTNQSQMQGGIAGCKDNFVYQFLTSNITQVWATVYVARLEDWSVSAVTWLWGPSTITDNNSPASSRRPTYTDSLTWRTSIITYIINDLVSWGWRIGESDFCFIGNIIVVQCIGWRWPCRFISQNCEKLYRERLAAETQTNIKMDNDQVEEHAALLPPFEVFTKVDEDDRCRHFFDVSSLDIL